MRNLVSVPILCLLLFSCGGGGAKPVKRAADPAALIARGMVFHGGEGVRVELIELKADNAALIQVTGTRSEVEGKVLEHRIREEGERMYYTTQIYGRDQNTLVREKSRYGGDPSWNLYVRGSDISGMQVGYDQKASNELDTVALYRKYEDQRADGTLAALERFDRKREQRDEEASLAEAQKLTRDACKADVAVSIDWSTIDDETLKDLSISGYCEPGLDAMRQLCESEAARAYVAASVKKYQCQFGGEMKLAVADQTMTWTTSREGVNMDDFARKALREQPTAKGTLGQQIALAGTKVCADEKNGRYIVFAPEGGEHAGMLYGDGKTFRPVPHPQMMSEGWFFDPRFSNPQNNADFRGLDLRVHSYVEVSDKEPTCTLMCGTRKTEFALLSSDKVPELMSKVQVEPAPMHRVPHALARDQQGTYYYVDRSTEPGRERDFQLYVG
ncbi:MAG TPA: hypothetical protein VNM90_11790, partial [Haliangium sp.]|nr:hypothetical protein [Haliangium sp.]